MSNNSESSTPPKSRFSGSSRIVMVVLVVSAVVGTGLLAWKIYSDIQNDANRDTRSAELIKEQAKQFNQSRTTETGTLVRVTDEAIVVEVDDDEVSFEIRDETEFNRGNAYEPVESDTLKSGATVSVTYTVESRMAVGVWQHED